MSKPILRKEPCAYCGGKGRRLDDERTGAQMRKAREGVGLSLRGLAKIMELSPAYLSELEHGKTLWKPDLRARYLRAVRCG